VINEITNQFWHSEVAVSNLANDLTNTQTILTDIFTSLQNWTRETDQRIIALETKQSSNTVSMVDETIIKATAKTEVLVSTRSLEARPDSISVAIENKDTSIDQFKALLDAQSKKGQEATSSAEILINK